MDDLPAWTIRHHGRLRPRCQVPPATNAAGFQVIQEPRNQARLTTWFQGAEVPRFQGTRVAWFLVAMKTWSRHNEGTRWHETLEPRSTAAARCRPPRTGGGEPTAGQGGAPAASVVATTRGRWPGRSAARSGEAPRRATGTVEPPRVAGQGGATRPPARCATARPCRTIEPAGRGVHANRPMRRRRPEIVLGHGRIGFVWSRGAGGWLCLVAAARAGRGGVSAGSFGRTAMRSTATRFRFSRSWRL